MDIKDKLVLVIGLVVISFIAVVIINGNKECADYEAMASEATNGVLLQQKDALIVKLMNQMKTRQSEVDSLKADLIAARSKLEENKAEFEDVKKRLDNIRAEVNAPVGVSASKK